MTRRKKLSTFTLVRTVLLIT